MGKKALIITIYDLNPNYGNRLQNYAVQEVIKKEDLVPTTICISNPKSEGQFLSKCFIQKITNYSVFGNGDYWRAYPLKVAAFRKFNKQYIKTKRIKSLKEIDGDTDYYIVGSDQVWNPSWYTSLKRDLFLLTFAPPEKRICMAPSFGLCDLPEEWVDCFRNQLMAFPMLSVREKSGAELIYRLTGREAEVVIDPTLMLDEEEWLRIAKEPAKVDCSKKYILTYFLDNMTEKQSEYIDRIAKENGMEIYHMMDYTNPDLYASSPSEFIYLIKHAAIVMTDSFHACVFSFIFNRPFLVYKRNGKEQDMFSRIEDLLDLLSLQRKKADAGLYNDLFECDYSLGKERVAKERIKAFSFLHKTVEKSLKGKTSQGYKSF